jgi:hypothetical protein
MSTYLNYTINNDALMSQVSTNFYKLNDPNINFVFEFLPMNVSSNIQVTPVFQTYDASVSELGFIDVSATSIINVSAVNFSRLFKFESNDITFVDYPNQDIIYGVGNVSVFNVSFSQSTVIAGWANPATQFLNNTSLEADYIRNTAKEITGGYALADIFANQEEMIQGIETLDLSFNESLNNNIVNNYSANSGTDGMLSYPDNSNNMYTTACKQLLDSLLTNASTTRGIQFLDDLKEQSDLNLINTNENGDNQTTYYINFRPNDVLAVRISYIPKNGNGQPAGVSGNYLGSNLLHTRSYKVFLKMT